MLNSLVKIVKKKKKRIGRGIGSGKGGHTVGKGHEGQKARAGFKHRAWFEGGQTPLIRALPRKRGFKKIDKKEVVAINLSQLSLMKGDEISEEMIRTRFGIKGSEDVKVLGKGFLNRAIILKGVKVSKGARTKIEKAGGKVI
jgi:large subunit ribosomal protein L15